MREYKSNPTPNKPPKEDCGCKNKENDTVTQNFINQERTTYCAELDLAASAVYQAESNFWGIKKIKYRKKCLFIWTEKNYRVVRNVGISIGTSLLQFNESIKETTGNLVKSNKTLADNLKEVLKKLKEAKAKIYELNTAATDLKQCVERDCNCTQWAIITGDWSGCKDKTRDQPTRPSKCENVKEKFEDLFCIPGSITKDIESIYKGAADVVGIQVFSNISSLEEVQKTLYINAKDFDTHLQNTMKKGEGDLKNAQGEYVKQIQEFAKSKATLFNKRSEFEGLFETVSFFCCPDCGCIEDKKCEERLHKCKKKICEICDEVKDTFCGCDDDQSQSTAS
ncbi:MAG: hypothetical protein ABWZ25_15815 [Chitinophagaceae bacterium]